MTTSRSDKPAWLEDWRVPDTPGPMTCVYSDERNVALLVRSEDAQLIAAAPALVRALLAVEWTGEAIGRNGEPMGTMCPYCEAEPGNKLPGDQKHGYARCVLDAALTAAGLPDQASRDAAREATAKR